MQLAPRRAVLADRYQGDPLDCIGGNPNDLTADSKGGVYFTMGGVYYARPERRRHEVRREPRHRTGSSSARTRRRSTSPTARRSRRSTSSPDGSLTNQREFARLEGGGNGDGSTIDAAGRIYVTTNPGVQVISPEGKYLGIIPTPRGVISVAFGGTDKKTLFVLARGATDANGTEVANAAQVYAIQMIAQGYQGRAK